jgi:hypothetical protein
MRKNKNCVKNRRATLLTKSDKYKKSLGSWLLALGSWLLALGSWLLALGSWLLALGSYSYPNTK